MLVASTCSDLLGTRPLLSQALTSGRLMGAPPCARSVIADCWNWEPEIGCLHLLRGPPCAAEPRTTRRQIDGRTTRHPGYAISQKKRKRIEECFGWPKTIALIRKVRHRGLGKVHWIFTLACAAYNLVRMRNLAQQYPWNISLLITYSG
jgi:Transposase DDE domain